MEVERERVKLGERGRGEDKTVAASNVGGTGEWGP